MKNSENIGDPSLEGLRQRLTVAGIDLSGWGFGQAKTLEHLWKEIEDGETVLVVGKGGELLRQVAVCGADIFYTSPDGKKYRLKEDRQVFKDGRVRRRNLGQAVSEKMKPNEDPKTAMVRGVQEELGIDGDVTVTKTSTDELLADSPSYPGLQMELVRHLFQIVLHDAQFKPEGYTEEQTDKSTYFIWEEIGSCE